MDSEEGNVALNIARIDVLSKLSSCFDQLAPLDKITSANECTKRQAINNMRAQEKALSQLVALKERMKDQIGRRATQQILFLQNSNIDADQDMSTEYLTSVLSKGSFDTMDCSEQLPASATSITHPDLGQVSVAPQMMRDKHIVTLIKMIETILYVIQQDNSKDHQVKSQVSRDVQVNLLSIDSDEKATISARDKQRLSLEERIRARKSEVQDTNEKQKDLELKGLRYQIEMLQQKNLALNEDKMMAELKVQGQEQHIKEQFEIIQDYQNEIKELQIENKQFSIRVNELSQQIHNVINSGAVDNIDNIQLTPINPNKEVKDTDQKLKVKNVDYPEVHANSDEENSNKSSKLNEEEDIYNDANQNHFNVFANSFHICDKLRVSMSLPKLNEPIDQINQDTQISSSQTLEPELQNSNLQTPLQTTEKIEYQATTQQTMAETAGVTPTTGVEMPTDEREKELVSESKLNIPAQLADDKKLKDKKQKATFEFPDGGWECSKCQNYNFKGRKECNRCKKVRTKQDFTGKPLHLLKNELQSKDNSAGLKLQRVKMQKNGKFKNLKVDTNLGQESERMEIMDNSALDSVVTSKTSRDSPIKKNQSVQLKEVKDVKVSKDDKKIPQSASNTDWVCQRCHNHNFSFRNTCNMCHLSHDASLKMLYLMNINTQGPKNNIPQPTTGFNQVQKLPINKSQKVLMPPSYVNLPQSQMRERVVHVHQYFNTYQVQPQSGYMQQSGQNMGQLPSQIQTNPSSGSLQGQTQTPKKQGFQSIKPGQPMPQWRPNMKTMNSEPTTNSNTANEWQVGTLK